MVEENVNSKGITLTWGVSAIIDLKPKGVKNKVQNRIKKIKKKNDVEGPVSKKILDNVAGIVRPGQLCAIMGASGAGKTTLLNILNFRNRGKINIIGDVKINGKVANWDLISRYSGYVQQDDLFIATLTVKEHLTFLAMLKMGNDYTKEQILKRVDEVIIEMNLVKSENTYIGMGDRVKGISGGEKRRLAFASETLTDPSLLFADEPTSGLDSFMAESVIDAMYNLAVNKNKTMITTIHQPSSQIFEKFNTLCLLAEGRLTYLGPAKDAINYFSSIGYHMPNMYNPADFFIHTLAIEPNNREECLEKVKVINDKWSQNPLNAAMLENIKVVETESVRDNSKKRYEYTASFPVQLRWLFWRTAISDLRNPQATKVLLLQTIIISIFIGLIFLQLSEDEVGVQNRIGTMFILLMQCNFAYIFATINAFPFELPLVYREIKGRNYSALPYYLTKTFAEMPKYFFLPFLLSTIIYWMSNLLNNFGVYIQVALTYVLNTQIAIAYASLISILAPNAVVAFAMVIPLLLPLVIFAGFFLNSSTTPVYFIWIKYLSWLYYTNEVINSLIWSNTGPIPCSKLIANGTCPSKNCFKDGDQVLDSLDFTEDNIARNILIMIAMWVVMKVMGFVLLHRKIKKL